MTIKKNEPFVSVVLDNYNYEKFLSEAIESVLSQTYKNYEIILVDDGSQDDSREIIEQYAARYPVIFPVFKQNGGQMSAFNEAFAKSKGDILAFLDSDDYWYPDKLEKIVAMHKKYDLVQHYLSHNGKGIYRQVHEDVDWHAVLMEFGYLYNHSVCSSLSFSRELIVSWFPFTFPEKMRYCADGILLMMALSFVPVGIISEVLGFYRVHGHNGFIGKDDHGERARRILDEQHCYVNEQLLRCGKPTIPFSSTGYFMHLIDRLQANGKICTSNRCVLYGTEASGLYMTKVLEQRSIPIYAYGDSSKEKQRDLFLGCRVMSPAQLWAERNCFDLILITSSAFSAIASGLEAVGFRQDKDYLILPI